MSSFFINFMVAEKKKVLKTLLTSACYKQRLIWICQEPGRFGSCSACDANDLFRTSIYLEGLGVERNCDYMQRRVTNICS